MKRKKRSPILQTKPDWNWEPSLKTLRGGFTLCVFVILLVTILVLAALKFCWSAPASWISPMAGW